MPEVLSVEMGAVLEASIKDLEEQVEKVLADNRPKHPKSFYDLPLKFDPRKLRDQRP